MRRSSLIKLTYAALNNATLIISFYFHPFHPLFLTFFFSSNRIYSRLMLLLLNECVVLAGGDSIVSGRIAFLVVEQLGMDGGVLIGYFLRGEGWY